jgi:putative nucleotidyltransferase with HDIG domain
LGSAAAILALLMAFAFFYRRSVRARSRAERLAQENDGLLAASREEALTDALTGLGNRRALILDLTAHLADAGREGQLVLALFDVDGFKQYNDTFGYPAGDALLTRLGERSPELEEHLSGVARLAARAAQQLGLPEPEVKRIRLAAELHDVGKTAIPMTILNKPGPLNDDEWTFMRRHTIIGERIIRAAPSPANVADLVRASHERYDSAGYPDSLRGDQIPIGASIVAVCDAYDAMVSDRPYRAATPVADALAELRRCSGGQFRPDVVDAFCAIADELEPVPAQTT